MLVNQWQHTAAWPSPGAAVAEPPVMRSTSLPIIPIASRQHTTVAQDTDAAAHPDGPMVSQPEEPEIQAHLEDIAQQVIDEDETTESMLSLDVLVQQATKKWKKHCTDNLITHYQQDFDDLEMYIEEKAQAAKSTAPDSLAPDGPFAQRFPGIAMLLRCIKESDAEQSDPGPQPQRPPPPRPIPSPKKLEIDSTDAKLIDTLKDAKLTRLQVLISLAIVNGTGQKATTGEVLAYVDRYYSDVLGKDGVPKTTNSKRAVLASLSKNNLLVPLFDKRDDYWMLARTNPMRSLSSVPQTLLDFVTGKVDTSAEVIDLTDLQRIVLRQLAAAPRGQTLDQLYATIRPLYNGLRRRDGSTYAANSKRALHASLTNNTGHKPLFHADAVGCWSLTSRGWEMFRAQKPLLNDSIDEDESVEVEIATPPPPQRLPAPPQHAPPQQFFMPFAPPPTVSQIVPGLGGFPIQFAPQLPPFYWFVNEPMPVPPRDKRPPNHRSNEDLNQLHPAKRSCGDH